MLFLVYRGGFFGFFEAIAWYANFFVTNWPLQRPSAAFIALQTLHSSLRLPFASPSRLFKGPSSLFGKAF
jgi:hypothetical protein